MNLKMVPVNHAGPDREKYVTLASLINIDGVKIFHLADIAPPTNLEYFKKFQLQKEKIDIAFIDPFFIQDSVGFQILQKYIQPQKIVLMHLRDSEIDQYYDEIKQTIPGIIVFRDTMEKKIFKKTL